MNQKKLILIYTLLVKYLLVNAGYGPHVLRATEIVDLSTSTGGTPPPCPLFEQLKRPKNHARGGITTGTRRIL